MQPHEHMSMALDFVHKALSKPKDYTICGQCGQEEHCGECDPEPEEEGHFTDDPEYRAEVKRDMEDADEINGRYE